jgi:serine protease Do
MKKYIFFAGTLIATLLLSTYSEAQKPEPQDKKTKEIIIRKNGDKNTKTTIEIDGDKILVNGKPLSEYHGDDISVIKRDFMKQHSNNFAWAPDNDEDMDLNFSYDNDTKAGPRTFLGVITAKTGDGVKITKVVKGSAAEKAGLQKDDVITAVNGKKINSPEDLMETVRSYKPQEDVKIDYTRNEKKNDTKVKLGETRERSRTFFYKDDNGGNGDEFNFKMPPMPPMAKMPRFPNNYYNYNFDHKNNPKLGLKIEDVENGSGAKVLNVTEGSAADKAGLKKDDIITEINDEKVDNVDEIKERLDEAGDKETLNLKAKRNNSEMNFEIKIPKQLNNADL